MNDFMDAKFPSAVLSVRESDGTVGDVELDDLTMKSLILLASSSPQEELERELSFQEEANDEDGNSVVLGELVWNIDWDVDGQIFSGSTQKEILRLVSAGLVMSLRSYVENLETDKSTS